MASQTSQTRLLRVPVPFKATDEKNASRDLAYHLGEWTSGARGLMVLPNDFVWRSNPKQNQEENGVASATKPLSSQGSSEGSS